jgi:hypothetical protein
MNYNMYRAVNVPYGQLSSQILNQINDLSGLILTIERMNNALISNSAFNRNPDFLNYITNFDSGKYFFFQCQGYMKALTLTGAFSKPNLCYWLTNLFYPSVNRFNTSINHFNKMRSQFPATISRDLNRLVGIISEFNRELKLIMEKTKSYNISC